MKRGKKIVSILMCMLLSICMMPAKPDLVKAAYTSATNVNINVSYKDDSANYGKVQYSLNGTDFIDLTTATVSVAIGQNLYLKLVPNDGCRVDLTAIHYQDASVGDVALSTDSTGVAGALTGQNGYKVTDNVTEVTIRDIEFKQDNGGHNGPQGSNHALIRLTGPTGDWAVNPMVRDDYDTVSENGATGSYARYAYTVSVSVNDSQRTRAMNQYRKNSDLTEYEEQTVDYNPNGDGSTVAINLFTNWGNRIEAIKINGTPYQVPINFDNRNQWLNAFTDQGINLVIPNVPVSTTIENGSEVYEVEVKVRPITEEECFIGNFLWTNDSKHFDPEITGVYDDQYIGHSRLELLSVTFDDGLETRTMSIDQLIDENGHETYPFVHFQLDRENFETGAKMSEMVIPEGSWVTMKIEPEYGYQVKSFELGSQSIRIGETSVFSFQIGKGNFHIGAHVEKQSDDTKVETEAVKEAGIQLAEGTLDAGSARLYVEDADVSDEKAAEFDEYAEENGYAISAILDINMSQVFFKGTGNSDDVWANPMEELETPAQIGLELEGYHGEMISLLHNIHDGDEYEEIPLTYDEELDMYVGEVSGFSNFAIAEKEITNSHPTPKTGDHAPIVPALLLFAFGLGLETYAVLRKMNQA